MYRYLFRYLEPMKHSLSYEKCAYCAPLNHPTTKGKKMSFHPVCPKCQGSMAGAKIVAQGKTTWESIAETWCKSGLLQEGCEEMLQTGPPGKDLFYFVFACCPQCGIRQADFLLASSKIKKEFSNFKEKVWRYKANDKLIPAMFQTEFTFSFGKF